MDAHTPSMLDFLNVESLPVLIENIAMKAHKLHGFGNDLSNLVRRGGRLLENSSTAHPYGFFWNRPAEIWSFVLSRTKQNFQLFFPINLNQVRSRSTAQNRRLT